MSDRTHFVYTAWDAAGRALYVGCTKDLGKRIRYHRGDKADWLQYATRYTMSGPYPKATALRLERERIVTVRPHFNWQPEHAAALRARHRDGVRNGVTEWDRMAGLDITREGRHELYRQTIGAANTTPRRRLRAVS